MTLSIKRLARRVAMAAGLALGLSLTLTMAPGGGFTGPANAASCWNHNGSVMRITATGGGGREIRYLRPRAVLRNAGVRRGTLLFNGFYNGRTYSGTARRFSRFCPGSPQTYGVSGPANNSRIVLRGSRDKNRRCQPTGRRAVDRLVFTFLYAC